MDDRPDRRATPSGAAGQERASYDRDLYSWAVEQAALLRAGRIAEADVLNIAEEIDDVGKSEYYRLESALRIILIHLLKWDHQPERRSRSWHLSGLVQRNRVQRVLRDNPGLKPLIGKAMNAAYDDACSEAAEETGLKIMKFPLACPYSWEVVLNRPIESPEWD
jgi:hypothetical protein